MSVFTLDKDHPLTKAGLHFVHVVQKVEAGLQPGYVVIEFPFGRIIDTRMACRRDGIIPADVHIMTIHKEAMAARAACNEQGQEMKGGNVLSYV